MTNEIRSLVVDDEAGIRFLMQEILRRDGHEVTVAATGEEALELLRDTPFDLAIVDLHLGSHIDGLRLLEAIRWRWPNMAVIIFTAHGSLETAMAAIRESVDGYLLKPAEQATVLATAREALARRQPNFATPETSPHLLCYGPIVLDINKHAVSMAGNPVELTPAEFSLLAHLVENANRVVTQKELVRVTRGYEADYQQAARQVIKWYIHRLRVKIEPDPTHPRYILNVRGVGYTLGDAAA